MNKSFLHARNLPPELVQLLGLPKFTSRFSLTVDLEHMAELQVTYSPEVDLDQVKQWPEELTERFHLIDTGRSAAIADVLAERQRQIEVEGWTPEHDDQHKGGSMALAAACYAVASAQPDRVSSECVSKLWPWTGWAWQWWKPKDKRHNLVRAGALILAELERLDRASDVPVHKTGGA